MLLGWFRYKVVQAIQAIKAVYNTLWRYITRLSYIRRMNVDRQFVRIMYVKRVNVDRKFIQIIDGQFMQTTYATRTNLGGYYIQTIDVQFIQTIGGKFIQAVYVIRTYNYIHFIHIR